MISIDDFKKIDLRVGKILEAEVIEGSEKLLLLKIDIGSEVRQILAGIQKYYSPADLLGQLVIVMVNLEPRSVMGLESQGMLLAAVGEDIISILMPQKEVLPGSVIR